MTAAGAPLGWDVVAAVTLACLAASAFFSGSETGLMSVSRVRLRHRARRGPQPQQARLERLLVRVEEPILTFLIGNNLANVLLSAVATAALAERWGARGAWLAGVLVAALVIVFGDLLPKVVFREYPERLTLAVTPAIRVTMALLWPVRLLLRAYTRLWHRLLPGDASADAHAFSREALAALLLGHPELGSEDERFGDVLRRFLALANQPVREIMVPLARAVVVPTGAGLAEATAVAARSGYSRLPVAAPDGGVGGWLLARDLLFAAPAGAASDAPLPPGLLRSCLFVDAEMSPHELFEEMQWQRQQLGMVVDRAGRVVGLVTLEDLVEAVVGRIEDEFDEPLAEAVPSPA